MRAYTFRYYDKLPGRYEEEVVVELKADGSFVAKLDSFDSDACGMDQRSEVWSGRWSESNNVLQLHTEKIQERGTEREPTKDEREVEINLSAPRWRHYHLS
jgi:hypothetical protein